MTDEDVQALQERLSTIIDEIKTSSDPEELNEVRRVFRKNVPFFMRAYVAAYLLKGGNGSPKKRKTSSEMATLFVGIGKTRRVFPRDIIQLFSGVDGIEAPDIGEIKILENYSFVEVKKDKAEAAIAKLNGQEFRKRKLNVNYARRRD